MTDIQQTTSLRDAAQAWKAKVDWAHDQQAAEENKQQRERAREVGQEVFDKVLGQDLAQAGIKLDPVTWAAEDPGETGRVWSATASIEGFMFRAQERYAGADWGGYKRELYVLRICNKDTAHGFEQAEVDSLYGLGAILTDPGSVTWTCGTCSWEAYEERENRPVEMAHVKTIGEKLEELIYQMIEDRIDARQNF